MSAISLIRCAKSWWKGWWLVCILLNIWRKQGTVQISSLRSCRHTAFVLRNNRHAFFQISVTWDNDLQNGEENQKVWVPKKCNVCSLGWICESVCERVKKKSSWSGGGFLLICATFPLWCKPQKNDLNITSGHLFYLGLSNTQSSSIKWLETALWTQPLAELPFKQKCKKFLSPPWGPLFGGVPIKRLIDGYSSLEFSP